MHLGAAPRTPIFRGVHIYFEDCAVTLITMKEIEAIIELYDHARPQPMALGTIVRVEGSAYRGIGGRMLVTQAGQWRGAISGGCLEGDALRRAQQVIHSGEPRLVVYDTRSAQDEDIGVGLGCEGRIEVQFVPLRSGALSHPLETLRPLLTTRTPVTLLQLLQPSRHFAGEVGALYRADSGLSAKASPEGQAVIAAALERVELRRQSTAIALPDGAWLALECLLPRLRLVVFGDNHDVTPLAQAAQLLGWELYLVGKPRKYAKVAFQAATQVYEPQRWPASLLDAHTAVVLLSHDLATDLAALPQVLPSAAFYLGILGPSKRLDKLAERLSYPSDWRCDPRLHAPIGLDIGAITPEEIALAITSEIIAVQREREAGFLRHRQAPIHNRL